MVFENGVKNIQAAAYNGASTVVQIQPIWGKLYICALAAATKKLDNKQTTIRRGRIISREIALSTMTNISQFGPKMLKSFFILKNSNIT